MPWTQPYTDRTTPVVFTSSLPNGTTGVPYSQTLVAMFGVQPYSWFLVSISDSNSGLSLSSSGVLSGIPTTAETINLTVKVIDAVGVPSAPANLSFSISGSGPAFDFFISTTGSDANSGTSPSNPWAITSLQDTNANNTKIVSKKVGLIAGSYNIASMTSGSNPGDYQHPILHIPTGTTANPTFVASCDSNGNYSPRTATIQWGGSGINNCIGQNPGGLGAFTMDGLVVLGSTSASSCKQMGLFPSASATNILIQNCEFGNINVGAAAQGSNDGAIWVQGVTNAVIVKNNYFHDIHKPGQGDHCHAYIEYNCVGTQFIFNTCVNCDTGIDDKVADDGTIVAYNYFYNCGFGSGSSSVIQGFDGNNGNSGVIPDTTPYQHHHNVFDSCNQTRTCDVNVRISHTSYWFSNTVYNTQTGSPFVGDLRVNSGYNLKSYNSIYVCTANTGGGIGYGNYALWPATSNLSDYNCFNYNSNSSGWGLNAVTQNSLAAFVTATGFDTHSASTNPVFASTITPGAGSKQFQLNQSTSPVRAAGATPGRVGGVIGGTAIDMGAWGFDPALGTAPTRIGCDHDGLVNS